MSDLFQDDPKITYLVVSTGDGSTATFYLGDLTDDVLCSAWFSRPNMRKIRVATDWTSIERAEAVSAAVQFASEWLRTQT